MLDFSDFDCDFDQSKSIDTIFKCTHTAQQITYFCCRCIAYSYHRNVVILAVLRVFRVMRPLKAIRIGGLYVSSKLYVFTDIVVCHITMVSWLSHTVITIVGN